MNELPPGEEEPEQGPPETGTAMDEFLPIYWLLGHATKRRPGYTADAVDRLDLSVVAALLGIRPEGEDDEFGPLTGDFAADSAALARRRIAEAKGEAVAH